MTRATRTKTPLARSLSRTMKNRYCIESTTGRVQWDFSPANCISCRVCGQSAPEPSKAGTDYHPLSLSSLAPSAVCPGPFSMRDIPKALLPGWLLVSLLDTGQLKLGANCSLCWPSGPRRPQFRLICEVTPLENANSATVDRETHTINFLSESGTTKFPIPTLTCRHTQVTNGGFMGK